MRRLAAAFVAAGLFLLGSPAALFAAPQTWTIDSGASKFGIIYQINGEQYGGDLGRFSGTAVFDPEALGEASLDLLIDMDSIDVGNRFGTAIIKTSDWFDVDNHPTATYRLNRLELIGGNEYRAFGTLTMRGAEAEVEGKLMIDLDESKATTNGRAGFNRSAFGIGVGFTALFVEVGDEVAVDFVLIANPVE